MTLPDIDSIASYNGAPGGVLQDYHGVEDVTTDQPAAGATAQQATTAMMTRTLPRAMVCFTYVSGGSAPVTEHDAVWGNSVSVLPTVARSSAGLFQITFPATVTDAIGVSHSVNLRRGWANLEIQSSLVVVGHVRRVSANVAEVRLVQDGGSAYDPVGIPVTVWMI
jgi:hypothetical protein